MVYTSDRDLFEQGRIHLENGLPVIEDVDFFKQNVIDNLVDTLVLSDSEPLKELCHKVARAASQRCGIYPASIQNLYMERAKKDWTHFSVPAVNLRTLTKESARAAFRAAKKIDAGAFVFEIARSEMAYTRQRPQEFASQILLAALAEEHSGPVFLQGDHFQVHAKKYFSDREQEMGELRDLIAEAIAAGFYNIDIDSSTLVDLSESRLDKQQRHNIEACARLTEYIRSIQPPGVEISIGGEIGEVGRRNSTLADLSAFMEGYLSETKGLRPLSKISIQTGTSHGGVVNPDGSIADVTIDFETLQQLSREARSKYGMAGAVQHGASTLPRSSFSLFPKYECAEIHLATQFQNIIYDFFPRSLLQQIEDWLRDFCAGERTEEMTEAQFIYKTRKKALGPFKREIFHLPEDLKTEIGRSLEEEFHFLFTQLNIGASRALVLPR